MKIVQFVFARPERRYQTRRFQYFQVLRDCLSRQAKLMLHSQATAQLEKGLAIPINEFVKNRTARRSSDCLEDIAHNRMIGKSILACQELSIHGFRWTQSVAICRSSIRYFWRG